MSSPANTPAELFGVLNLHKPADVTSRDVVNVVQRLVRPAKVGHAGTLDPMATGVLLVCLGPATRLVSVLQQAPKTYDAEFRLGQRSDTDDSTGDAEDVPGDHHVTMDDVTTALRSFQGVIQQTPPAYSAVKSEGRRAYELARRGENVELSARPVRIDAIEITHFEWPMLSVTIRCGSGTYIRSIARDLGESLGCGGLMSRLARTAIGEFRVTDAVDPASLTVENLHAALVSPVCVVGHISRYLCSDEETALVARGGSFLLDRRRLTKVARLRSPGADKSDDLPQVALLSPCGTQLLAMGEIRRQGRRIQPRTVFTR